VLYVNFSSPIGATGKVPPIHLNGKHSSHSKYSSHSGPSSFTAFRSLRLSSFPYHFCFPVVPVIPVNPGNPLKLKYYWCCQQFAACKSPINNAVPTENGNMFFS
jgi:hypothetical protein